MRRQRKAKILATLGPASSNARADFRAVLCRRRCVPPQFQHGTHEDHQARYELIREIEEEMERPIGILMDLQGPKLRVGTFIGGSVELKTGGAYRLDSTRRRATRSARSCRIPKSSRAIRPGTNLLIDDGRLRLRVKKCGGDFAECDVLVGGKAQRPQGRQRPRRRAAALAAHQEGSRRICASASISVATGWRCRSCSGRRTSPSCVS